MLCASKCVSKEKAKRKCEKCVMGQKGNRKKVMRERERERERKKK